MKTRRLEGWKITRLQDQKTVMLVTFTILEYHNNSFHGLAHAATDCILSLALLLLAGLRSCVRQRLALITNMQFVELHLLMATKIKTRRA